MFARTSRYYGIETAQLALPDGRVVVYVKRRFVPATGNDLPLDHHTVTRGDRLDNVTAIYLRDPEQFWRVADANGAMKPEELTEEIGRVILIPTPRST